MLNKHQIELNYLDEDNGDVLRTKTLHRLYKFIGDINQTTNSKISGDSTKLSIGTIIAIRVSISVFLVTLIYLVIKLIIITKETMVLKSSSGSAWVNELSLNSKVSTENEQSMSKEPNVTENFE